MIVAAGRYAPPAAGLFLMGLLACSGDTMTDLGSPGPPAVGGGGSGGQTTSSSSTGGGGATVTPSSCPEGTFAVGLDAEGLLSCEPITDLVHPTLNERCSVYFGWRDSCDGCNDQPSKWGRASGQLCENGGGSDNTCTTPSLGGVELPLFGLNTDGDVNGDDKFSLGLHCESTGESALPGPCQPGELISYIHSGLGFVECRTVEDLLVRYVQDHCSLYWGFRDSCDGCTDPPAKWGRTQGITCEDGAGDDNSCYAPFLGGRWVVMFGLNTDGDVDGNDKLYVGLSCAPAEPAAEVVTGPCPSGKVVTAVQSDGTVQCVTVNPEAAALVQSGCFVYFGWRDSCNGCSDDPVKWGRVSSQSCELGSGSDSGCSSAVLAGQPLDLLGINTDGDVNGDDKLYVGWHCM